MELLLTPQASNPISSIWKRWPLPPAPWSLGEEAPARAAPYPEEWAQPHHAGLALGILSSPQHSDVFYRLV